MRLILAVAALAAGLVLPARAQSLPEESQPPVRKLLSLEHRSAMEMTPEDRALLAARQAELNTAALRYGYDAAGGAWEQEQTFCPLFPDYLLVRYQRDAGSRAATRFVALVPRQAGAVEVVAILRKGRTPFAPSYRNKNTMAVFNRVSAREGLNLDLLNRDFNWVKLGLCYAAMNGEEPVTLLTDHVSHPVFVRNANSPALLIGLDESPGVEFTDVSNPAQTQQWDLHFDRHLRLVSAERIARPIHTTLRTQAVRSDLTPAPQIGTQAVREDLTPKQK